MFLAAESIYRNIFGSQILILKQLNTSGPAPKTQLMTVYNNVRARWPEAYASYSFDQYVAFLIGWGLINELDDLYAIKDMGKEFLKWMVTVGVSEQKQL